MTDLHLDQRFDDLAARVDRWAHSLVGEPLILAVDRGTSDDTRFGEPRWYVRMEGDDKDVITVWFTLGQRTLRYETYVLPAPPQRSAEINRLLLSRNDQLVGVHFSIGAEDAIYLRGELPDAAIDTDELDRVLGTIYAAVEANFAVLVNLAFGVDND